MRGRLSIEKHRFDEILEFGYEFAHSKITDEWVQSLIDKNKGEKEVLEKGKISFIFQKNRIGRSQANFEEKSTMAKGELELYRPCPVHGQNARARE